MGKRAKGRKPQAAAGKLTCKMRDLSGIGTALNGIKGQRPTMLAWRIYQIRKVIGELQDAFKETLAPFLDQEKADGAGNVPILKDKVADVEKILDEQVVVDLPSTLTLEDLKDLTVAEDWHLGFLADVGIIRVE